MPKGVHLPFPSPFSTIYFATSGAGAAVINIHSTPLTKAGVPQGSCNSLVHHPSPANASSTARAKLPVNQTALKRDGTRESSHAVIAIPTCQGVGLTAGSGPRGEGEADHTPSSKTRPKTAFCTCLHQAGLPSLTQLATSTSVQGGSTGVKKIKESGWQQPLLKAELYKMSRE